MKRRWVWEEIEERGKMVWVERPIVSTIWTNTFANGMCVILKVHKLGWIW